MTVPYKIGMPKEHVDFILKKTGRREIMKPRLVFDSRGNPLKVIWCIQDATLTMARSGKTWVVSEIDKPAKDLPIENPVLRPGFKVKTVEELVHGT